MTVRFFFSVTGVERVWDGSRWRKVRAGHHLTTYLGPYLRALEDLVGYEKETDITYYESPAARGRFWPVPGPWAAVR